MGTFDDAAMSAYLKSRDDARGDQVDAMLACLTERERALVREAATLGFAEGVFAAGGLDRSQFPRDHQIVSTVLISATNAGGLYPNLSRLWIDTDEHSENIPQIKIAPKPAATQPQRAQAPKVSELTGVQKPKKARWGSSRKRRSRR